MLEAGAPDGAAVGEADEVEAVAEGGRLRCLHLCRHLLHHILLLSRVVTLGTRRLSLFCSCVGRHVAAFAFLGRLRGCWRLTGHRG